MHCTKVKQLGHKSDLKLNSWKRVKDPLSNLGLLKSIGKVTTYSGKVTTVLKHLKIKV